MINAYELLEIHEEHLRGQCLCCKMYINNDISNTNYSTCSPLSRPFLSCSGAFKRLESQQTCIFEQFMTMQEKQVLAGAIGIQKQKTDGGKCADFNLLLPHTDSHKPCKNTFKLLVGSGLKKSELRTQIILRCLELMHSSPRRHHP